MKPAKPPWAGHAKALCLSLSDILLTRMQSQRITRAMLAERTGIKPIRLYRIVYGRGNPTAREAGFLLHAVGVRRDGVLLAATPPPDRMRSNP